MRAGALVSVSSGQSRIQGQLECDILIECDRGVQLEGHRELRKDVDRLTIDDRTITKVHCCSNVNSHRTVQLNHRDAEVRARRRSQNCMIARRHVVYAV